jgi:hypothetical protein
MRGGNTIAVLILGWSLAATSRTKLSTARDAFDLMRDRILPASLTSSKITSEADPGSNEGDASSSTARTLAPDT